MSRLGISSSRAFSVGTLPEVTRVKPNTSLETALELKPNSICNAVMTPRAVDFYAFEAAKGKRVVVECAARGIDSKLNPVVIIADAQGRDLLVDRRGGLLDFKAPADGTYFIKVHDLTFQGGPAHFYRLALLEEPGTGPAPRQPSTTTVSSFSWPPDEASKLAKVAETEPNNQHAAGAEDHAALRDRGPVLSRPRTSTRSSSPRRRARCGGWRSRRSGSACPPIPSSSCSA